VQIEQAPEEIVDEKQVRALRMVAGALDDPTLEEIADRLDARAVAQPATP
jgi:hypothetical protein